MAKSQEAAYEKDMIDLGKEHAPMDMPMDTNGTMGKSEPTVNYPTLFIRDVPELDNLPDGEFYFMAKGQVTRHTEENPIEGSDEEEAGESPEEEASEDESTETEGEGHCSCEITVLSMKPLGDAATSAKKPAKTAEDSLSDALDTIAQKKADAAEDQADQGADEATEE